LVQTFRESLDNLILQQGPPRRKRPGTLNRRRDQLHSVFGRGAEDETRSRSQVIQALHFLSYPNLDSTGTVQYATAMFFLITIILITAFSYWVQISSWRQADLTEDDCRPGCCALWSRNKLTDVSQVLTVSIIRAIVVMMGVNFYDTTLRSIPEDSHISRFWPWQPEIPFIPTNLFVCFLSLTRQIPV
jgi:hypothetical protein